MSRKAYIRSIYHETFVKLRPRSGKDPLLESVYRSSQRCFRCNFQHFVQYNSIKKKEPDTLLPFNLEGSFQKTQCAKNSSFFEVQAGVKESRKEVGGEAQLDPCLHRPNHHLSRLNTAPADERYECCSHLRVKGFSRLRWCKCSLFLQNCRERSGES